MEGNVKALGAVGFAIVVYDRNIFGPNVGVVLVHITDMFEEVEFGGGLRGVADADATEENKVVVIVFPGEVVSGVMAVEFFGNGVDGDSEVFGGMDDGGRIDLEGVEQWTSVDGASGLNGNEIGASDFYRISRHHE